MKVTSIMQYFKKIGKCVTHAFSFETPCLYVPQCPVYFSITSSWYYKNMEHNGRKIPNHLRKFRKQMGLTQIEVASLLDFTSPKRIILWEQGKAHPGICNLFRLSIIYHTLPHELYPEYYNEMKESLLSQTEELLLTKHFPIQE